MAETLTGGCLCGAVRYEAAGPFHNASICHCSMCRKAGGGPYLAFASLPRAALRFIAEAPTLYRSSSTASRGFCGRCGTALTWQGDTSPAEIDLAIGTLDHPNAMPPLDQIFAADAVAWAQNLTGLPSHKRHRNDG